MWVRGIAGALASMGQWCGWWAGADLWSAGIPARMGGVVASCDMDGAFMVTVHGGRLGTRTR
jgi:hypothetical protein